MRIVKVMELDLIIEASCWGHLYICEVLVDLTNMLFILRIHHDISRSVSHRAINDVRQELLRTSRPCQSVSM